METKHEPRDRETGIRVGVSTLYANLEGINCIHWTRHKRRMPGGGIPFRNTFYDFPAVLSFSFTSDLVARATPRCVPRGGSTS